MTIAGLAIRVHGRESPAATDWHGHWLTVTAHCRSATIFDFDMDQTCLPAILRSCHAVLETYPVRGAPRSA